ncbi:MAG: hypothetical protein ACJAXX_002992 [Roseivirga sp.]|jgi:hypothetical protein
MDSMISADPAEVFYGAEITFLSVHGNWRYSVFETIVFETMALEGRMGEQQCPLESHVREIRMVILKEERLVTGEDTKGVIGFKW